jgi:PadR family transcriptional regulator, regulatory protein AphA
MDYQAIRLTPASYIVLGLLEHSGEATPYQLKGMLVASVGNFWSLQHAQLYSEPERLTGAGYLEETREPGGRRRKRYRLTDSGRAALHAWVSEPSSELPELRDVALLKLFFGAAPGPLAAAQLEAHREKLREYERMQEQLRDYAPPGPLATLAAGIAHEREWVRYWERLRETGEV